MRAPPGDALGGRAAGPMRAAGPARPPAAHGRGGRHFGRGQTCRFSERPRRPRRGAGRGWRGRGRGPPPPARAGSPPARVRARARCLGRGPPPPSRAGSGQAGAGRLRPPGSGRRAGVPRVGRRQEAGEKQHGHGAGQVRRGQDRNGRGRWAGPSRPGARPGRGGCRGGRRRATGRARAGGRAARLPAPSTGASPGRTRRGPGRTRCTPHRPGWGGQTPDQGAS